MGLLGGLFRWVATRGTPVPVGSHRAAAEGSVPDYTEPNLVFRLQLLGEDGLPMGVYVGETNAETRYTVAGKDVSVDGFLEAYDEGEGHIRLEAYEPGRLSAIGIVRGE